ncbi:hypothetical protein EVG20_g3463 [Dentipellis fragilis]|uniref:protein-histidine N-methyltransferase n=1 Tax=Dentipellis fragilis TaxID=205917 RepID=A0A4Y9Z3Q4_9AGAM|nr:hypothetical protein EVG20_g3463 [Dentipellis fragilis]
MSTFKFDFDLEDDLDEEVTNILGTANALSQNATPGVIPESAHEPFAEVPLQTLLDALPDNISYSPVSIPLSSGKPAVSLARRDLFDARLQLIAADEREDALEFLETPSDLVPCVYEGGLKTWECSIDLADYLDTLMGERGGDWVKGKAILEVGCGTAVPSIFLLHRLFAALAAGPSQLPKDTYVHLQDYNRSVLELITLPNIIIAWYMSPLSAAYRASTPPSTSEPPTSTPTADSDAGAGAEAEADPSVAGELDFSPSLRAAFQASLTKHHIYLRFFTGAWDSFSVDKTLGLGKRYDVVLTSETIYRSESLPALLRVLREASCGAGEEDIAARAANLSLEDTRYVCLVAAKVLYFGVGGGVEEFVDAVQAGEKGTVETVWERNVGVGRKVMKVMWR